MRKTIYKDRYIVYENGTVYNLTETKEYKHHINWAGYHSVFIEGKMRTVSRVVYEAFKGEIAKSLEIDHIDTNKDNNHLSNLRAVTHKENVNNPLTRGRLGRKPKRIGQYLGNILKKEFNSLTEVRASGFSISAVNSALRGRTRSSGGYTWKYL